MMQKPWIITIGREFCTGGSEIARKLADRLGYTYVDKEVIAKTADQLNEQEGSDLPEEEEEFLNNIPISWQSATRWYLNDVDSDSSVNQDSRVRQEKVLREFADKGGCIVCVGRSADIVLKDYPFLLNVFMHADLAKRVERCCRLSTLTPVQAKRFIRKNDRHRSEFYEKYTGLKWGDPSHYDMYIDLSKMTQEEAVDLIISKLTDREAK